MMDRKRVFAVKHWIFISIVMFSIYVTSYSRIFSNSINNKDSEEEGGDIDEMKEAILENRKRILLMKTTCENINRIFDSSSPPDPLPYPLTQYPLSSLLSPPGLDMLKLDKIHKISICVPFKAGSETWRYLLSSTGSNNTSAEQIVSKVNSLEEISDYKKAIQVRDPYERLLSAYRFTFEHGTSLKNSNNLNARLIDKYSYLPTDKDDTGEPTVSFPQFIQSIVSGYRDFSPDSLSLITDGAALHWLPFYMQCNPCNKEYSPTTIIKMETWLRDTQAFLNQSGIDPNRSFYLLNATPGGHSSDPELMKKYYSHVERSVLEELGNIYKIDFDLFGYDQDNIFNILDSV